MGITTDVQNPSPFSDFDWLEFVSFAWKVENEGYDYAAENYRPCFEDTGLPVDGDDLRDLYDRYVDRINPWGETVGWKRAGELHNDHVDEARQREKDACLWGVRCTDGHVIHVPTEDVRANWVAEMTGHRGAGWRVPAELLHREVPGGEWTDVRPVDAKAGAR